jgi:hypothetical protein
MLGGRLKGAAFGHGLAVKRHPQAAIEDATPCLLVAQGDKRILYRVVAARVVL